MVRAVHLGPRAVVSGCPVKGFVNLSNRERENRNMSTNLSREHVPHDRDEELPARSCERVAQRREVGSIWYVLFRIVISITGTSYREGLRHTILSERQIAPESMPFLRSVISMTHTPVSCRPSMSVCCIGAGPRYNGRRDGWTFSRLVGRNRLSRELGRIRPKEAVTSRWLGSGEGLDAGSAWYANGGGA